MVLITSRRGVPNGPQSLGRYVPRDRRQSPRGGPFFSVREKE